MARQRDDQRYFYILQYIQEAVEDRETLKAIITRTVNAYKKKPAQNTYANTARKYLSGIPKSDTARYDSVKSLCDSIPEVGSDVFQDTVENVVSMAMGGAEQFEYLPYDPYMQKDTNLIERLSSLSRFFHEDNKIDAMMPKIVRATMLQGSGNLYIKPNKEKKKFQLFIIPAYRMLKDRNNANTNGPRFIGFTEMRSWDSIVTEVNNGSKGKKISAINEANTYFDDLKSYASGATNWDGLGADYKFSNELKVDGPIFYSDYITKGSSSQDKSGKPVAVTEPGYKGIDAEYAYIIDLTTDTAFTVVNRRFILKVDERPFETTIEIETKGKPNKDGKRSKKKINKKVRIDSPFVEIPYLELDWSPYPYSPLWDVLDDFDDICSFESLMRHNFSVMAPITFLGSSFDAERLSKMTSIAGEIVEGTLNTMGVMAKSHDMSAVLAAVERREQVVKRSVGGYDQFAVQAMLGNRATAAEVGSSASAVSQRLNALLANLEQGMSELTQKLFDLAVIYFDKNSKIEFNHDGEYAEASIEDMLGTSMIHARLKSLVKLEQQQQSRNALQVMGYLGQADYIDKERFVADMVPIIMQGLVSRKQAERYVKPQKDLDPAQLKVGLDARDVLNQQREQDPTAGSAIGLEGNDLQQAEMSLLAAQGADPMSLVGNSADNGLDDSMGLPMPSGGTPNSLGYIPSGAPNPLGISSASAHTGPGVVGPENNPFAPGTSPDEAGVLSNQPEVF